MLMWSTTGLDGELCRYLEGLERAVDVQKYVEDHPFGQQRQRQHDQGDYVPSYSWHAQALQTRDPRSISAVRRY